jgi:hypothetical protein
MDAREGGGHDAYCKGEICKNGVFNFLGAYGGKHNYDRFEDLVKLEDAGIDHLLLKDENVNDWLAKAEELGTWLTEPDPSRTAYNPDAPYHWGNNSDMYNTVASVDLGNEPNQIVFTTPKNFVVFTINQWVTHFK